MCHFGGSVVHRQKNPPNLGRIGISILVIWTSPFWPMKCMAHFLCVSTSSQQQCAVQKWVKCYISSGRIGKYLGVQRSADHKINSIFQTTNFTSQYKNTSWGNKYKEKIIWILFTTYLPSSYGANLWFGHYHCLIMSR